MERTRFLTGWPIRRKLLLLVLLLFLPASAIIAVSGIRERQGEMQRAQTRALLLVESLAAQQEQIAFATKMLLSTLATSREVQQLDGPACSRLFRDIQQRYPFYSVIGATTADGTYFASSAPFTPGVVNLADRKHVQDAIRTRNFAVGEYILGRVSNVVSLNYTFPVLDRQQKLIAIVIAGFSLKEYARFLAKIDLASDDVVMILDWKGVRLFRLPETKAARTGAPISADFMTRISGGVAKGLVERVGEDGVERLYAFRQLRLDSPGTPPYLYMVAGLAKEPILAHATRKMWTSLAILGLIASLALAAAWRLGHTMFVTPINQLMTAAHRLARGELGARTGLAHTQDELGRLASAFDHMATLLETRSQEREQAEQALAVANAALEQRVQERTRALSTANAALTAENAERQQVEAALRARTVQLEAIREIGADLTRELHLHDLLHLVVQRALTLVGADSGAVHLWNEAEQAIVAERWEGSLAGWPTTVRFHPGEGVVGTVALRREGMCVNDYRQSPHAHPLLVAETEIGAVLAEPLCYQDRLLGVIVLIHMAGQPPFTEEDQALLRLLAAHAAIALENARLFQAQERAYVQLQQAQEELVRAEKLRALGQMAAGVAHDLNNMLAVILGQVELLRFQVQLSEVQAALEVLYTAASDGAQVVRRLQEFGRQQRSTSLVPCDLVAIAREALELTRPRWQDEAQRHGRQIEVATSLAGLPPILGHPAELREALTNLILNAIDAMPAGGTLTLAGAPDPTPSTEPGPGGVTLRVTDTGVGMSEEIQRHIFDPFFSTKGFQGTGLGLAVVYGIMERHGGRIDVTSAPGRGTTFALRFQAAAPGLGGAPRVAPPRPCPPQRILLIDDEASVRTTLASLLRALGHQVTEAEGGPAGLAALSAGGAELVITDFGMPEMTGWEVARRVKESSPTLPVILLTGWGQHVAGTPAERRDVDRILAKPVHVEELQAAITGLVAPGEAAGSAG